MKRIVVTGATGFIGQRVCTRLVAARREVVAVTRDGRAPLPPGISRRLIVGELGPATDWRDTFAADDTVVHLAARAHQGDDALARAEFQRVNVIGTARMLEAARAAGVAHVVYMSSAKVYGERSPPAGHGEPRAWHAADHPQPVGPYGESKLAAETLLRTQCAEAGIALTILRPPLVYGPGNKANLHALLRAIDRGWPLPLASIRNRRSLVYVDNLADLVLRVIDTAQGQRCYTVCDIDLSTPALVRALAGGLDCRPRLLPCPVAVLQLLGRLSGRSAAVSRLTESMVLDRDRVAQELGWQPAVDLASAMRAIGRRFRDDAGCR